MMEAEHSVPMEDNVPTFTLLGKVFKSVLYGKVKINPPPDKQRMIAEAQGY